jgi:hypothetical protein
MCIPFHEVTLLITIHLLSVRVTIPAPPLYQSGALPNELTDNMYPQVESNHCREYVKLTRFHYAIGASIRAQRGTRTPDGLSTTALQAVAFATLPSVHIKEIILLEHPLRDDLRTQLYKSRILPIKLWVLLCRQGGI